MNKKIVLSSVILVFALALFTLASLPNAVGSSGTHSVKKKVTTSVGGSWIQGDWGEKRWFKIKVHGVVRGDKFRSIGFHYRQDYSDAGDKSNIKFYRRTSRGEAGKSEKNSDRRNAR